MKYRRMHWDRRSPASNPHEKFLTVRNIPPLKTLISKLAIVVYFK